MRIRKDYYVIYEGRIILSYGATADRLIESSQIPAAEFDTEEELFQFIDDNHLAIPEVNNDY